MTSAEIRTSYLNFFRQQGHTIVPSGSLLPDAPNLLFTNAGMNQFVPIFLGQSPCPYQPARAADTQKCIRAGGKHNDLEDVGFDTYHHTFFEMLGNWSFGDYFKQDAIRWAWKLVVGEWKFPANRVYATVYQPGPGDPSAFDQEAYDAWAKIFRTAGLDPAVHIVNGNKKDNFWMMGDTGPCGPCSELHIDLTPNGDTKGALVNQGSDKCIEIWNLVFIQFNANADGTFSELPAKHVDTGMGFERVASIIQGTKNFSDFKKAKISNYETDIFRPLFDALERLTGHTYKSTLPAPGQIELSEQEKIDVAFRVIADHVRTLSFSIADGISPSNEGRGYVLRRILRRAVRYGRNLGLRAPFLAQLVDVLGAKMGEIFPEVVTKAGVIKTTLTNEEESFFRTLERGIKLFEEVIKSLKKTEKIFPGDQAFELADTYGFPLDLTELMARERGLSVDVAAFNRLLDEQKARARAAQKKEVITAETKTESGEALRPTHFTGFDELQTAALVVSAENDLLAVTETPFYAELGGQVGDTGEVQIGSRKLAVKNTLRAPNGVIFHKVAEPLTDLQPNERVTLHVDEVRRAKIEAHHSGTHLLHWALRKTLGTTVAQRGSYVGPDRLRFDFSHGAALTPEQVREIETLINEKIEENVPVIWEEKPYAQVKGDPSILQFFNDKYGETVRVVSIGDFSRELCGGTHVRSSSCIGLFKILSESAISSGVRRIEAVSGAGLIEHVRGELNKQEEQYSILKKRKLGLTSLSNLNASPSDSARDYWRVWEEREISLKAFAAAIAQAEKDEAKKLEAEFQARATAQVPELIAAAREIKGVPFLAQKIDAPAGYLPILADALKQHWSGIALFATTDEEQGKVALLASVGPAYVKKFSAGKIIQTLAPLVGGKGGGRPELAQGGGTNPAGLDDLLANAENLLS